MFDLDREIRILLKELNNKRLISRHCIDEIEVHVRDEIDDLVGGGLSVEEAFSRAKESIGDRENLLGEYRKLYGSSSYQQTKNILSYYFDGRVIVRVVLGSMFGLFFLLTGLLLEGGQMSQSHS